MAVVSSFRTRDGRYRVYKHEDQTAELCEVEGKANRVVIGRSPYYVIMNRLVDMGYEELIPE